MSTFDNWREVGLSNDPCAEQLREFSQKEVVLAYCNLCGKDRHEVEERIDRHPNKGSMMGAIRNAIVQRAKKLDIEPSELIFYVW